MWHENDCWWEKNGKKTSQVTDKDKSIITDFWEENYKISNDKVGMENHQYSLRLYELSLPRLFLAMNFVALFRQSAEEKEVNQTMVAYNIEEKLKQSDAVFLGLTPEATNYWDINPEIKLLPEQINQMTFDAYYHQLIKKNNPTYLDKLLDLPNLNQDKILHQLLHHAITYNAPATTKVILDKLDDFNDEEAYLDSLKNTKEISTWMSLKRPFQFKRMQEDLTVFLPDGNMLIEACSLNNFEAITYFFAQPNTNDILKEDGLALALVQTLLNSKAEMKANWDTMKEAIFMIVKKTLENCDADVSHAVIQQLQDGGLNESTKEGRKLTEIIQGFNLPEATMRPNAGSTDFVNPLEPSKQIDAKLLNKILCQYRPNSWTGWVLYLLTFGTHQSETMKVLRLYIESNRKDSFTIDELKAAIKKNDNNDSKKQHRIRLFEGKERSDESGTDIVIKNIINQAKPR